MLPFLKQKQVAGLIVAKRKPDGTHEEQHSEDQEDHGLEACATDLIRAIHAKDSTAAAAAMRAAFELMESEPHEEAGIEPTLEGAND